MQQKLASKRVGSIIKSAAIGGGFPLLFGGGITQAIPGLIGGALGEAASPGGGFAGSIAATALASSATQFANSAREVGNALKDPTEGLQKLKDAGFKVSESTERQIEALIKAGRKTEALELVQKEFAKTIGTLGTDNLKKLDTSFDALDDAVAKLVLKFQADLAPAFITIIDLATKFVDSVGGFRIQNKAQELDPERFRALDRQIRKELSGGIPGKIVIDEELRAEYQRQLTAGSKKIIQELMPEFLGNGDSTNTDGSGTRDPFDVNLEKTKLEKLVKQTEHYERILEVGFEQAELEKQIAEFKESASEAELKKIENGEINIKQLIDENREAKQLVENAEKVRDLYSSIASTIETGLVNAIDGAINGTKTLGDVARSVFSEIQRSLIRFGVNAFLGGLPGIGGFFRAEGGPVSRGGSYIVGERGPELFTPGSSGMITPNHALGSSTTVVVNVDASGSNVEGDEGEGRALGLALSAAIETELIKQKRPGGLLA